VRVAIVHDQLAHLAGGERVVLAMAKAFPGAPVFTSLYEPDAEFPEFRELDIRPTFLNRSSLLRRHHRWAMPLMATAFDRMNVDADVVVCSSAGWAHGVSIRPSARKVVYCHTPARWLYQRERYVGDGKLAWRAGLRLLQGRLLSWDKRAAASAHVYLANSRAVSDRIRSCYGIEARVLPPPLNLDPSGAQQPIAGIQPGYVLCVSRLLPYKNVGQIIQAVGKIEGARLVVVGTGPDESALRSIAPKSVRFLSNVTDESLRWLYANCAAIVSASYEDFGLAVVEAASLGKPAAALRWGGFLDSVVEEHTGIFFDEPTAADIAGALQEVLSREWDGHFIKQHALSNFGEQSFIENIQRVVDDQLRAGVGCTRE
jgi:glycosyltransferase involved in cell wall biosynthesis